MKAIQLHQYGTADDLQYEDVPQPKPEKSQVVVKVRATSVNHLEVMLASGKNREHMPLTFPWIPGYDFAGEVVETGEEVSGFIPGDKVYAKCTGGSYAEYVTVDADILAIKPGLTNFVDAASIPHTGLTAWQALYEHGALQPGQKVLIHGAAGAVGMFAVQFAKNSNAFVYGTAGAEDISFVKSLLADVVINYKTEDFTQMAKDVDLVIDLVGGETQIRSFGIIKEGGRLVTTTGKADLQEEPKGITIIPMVVHPDGKALQEISYLIEDEIVRTDVTLTFPLSESAQAWKAFDKHQTSGGEHFAHGKIVLEVG